MNKIERLDRIRQILQADRISSVALLADVLSVSQMTIRRDILALAQEGRVRVVNGVIFDSDSISRHGAGADYDLGEAEGEKTDEKQQIGKHAASLVEPGEIVFIDAGSTTENIVRYIPPSTPLTVICCSLNTILRVRHFSDARVLITGGLYHSSSMMFESPEAVELIGRYRATKAFISASGVRDDLGVTCSNQFEVGVKQSFLKSSLRRILVVDASKFGQVHTNWFANLSDFDTVITDKTLDPEYRELIRKQSIDVQIV